MRRNFEEWFDTLTDNIYGFDYYVDFDKVYKNVEEIKTPLYILNSLIGSKKIKKDFESIILKYPETLKCIPILLAIRQNEIKILDNGKQFSYTFLEKRKNDINYSLFMEKTGLFDLLQNRLINNLYDYVTGVEVGLDSNGRKNRGGHAEKRMFIFLCANQSAA